MLKVDLLENSSFLNSYLTEKDFSFISSLDKNIQEIDSKMNLFQKIRECNISLINNLPDTAAEDSIKNFSTVVDNTTIAFSYVNECIKLLLDAEEHTKALNSNIVGLLIDISSKKFSPDESTSKTLVIKQDIAEYSSFIDEINSEVSLKKSLINDFLKDPTTQYYFSKFNIDISQIEFKREKIAKFSENKRSNTEAIPDNNVLLISEKQKKVFLPYVKADIEDYLEQYPNKYKSYSDVINSEFIVPLSYYQHFPVLARFRETYSLIRDREGKSIVEALKLAMDLMFKSELNPAIIAACKYQEQLDNYLKCLESNNLESFNDFKIKFDVNLI